MQTGNNKKNHCGKIFPQATVTFNNETEVHWPGFFRFIFDTHRTGLHWQKKTVCGWGGVDQTVMSVRTGQVTSAEATHARTHTHKHTVLSFLKKNNKHFKLGALRSTCQENLHLRDKTEGAEALTGYQESEVCVKSPPRRQVTPVTTS